MRTEGVGLHASWHGGVWRVSALQPGTSSVARRVSALAIVVAALGYFVDIFDLLLFGIVRVPSLRDLGVPEDQLKPMGILLDNYLQTTGLVVGGIVWGVLGDRRGRLTVLFGSILTYSIANVLNGFIADVPRGGSWSWMHSVGLGTAIDQYKVLRVVAGFGLAGELGAGITLVAELVSRERRGLATTVVAAVGILGAVAAYWTTQLMSWRWAYITGGLLGLALLALRIGVAESGMFERARTREVAGRGAFWRLFWPPQRLRRYLCVILAAVPIWFSVGVLIKYADAIGASLGMPPEARPSPGLAIMWCYVGLALGDLASGVSSQLMRSRRGALWLFHALSAIAIAAYFAYGPRGLTTFYACATAVGFASGYWAVFVTMAAEQFGTDLRATAATSAPNFVRWSAAGSAYLWIQAESWLFPGDSDAAWKAAVAVGCLVLPVAVIAVFWLRESFDDDLDFEES
jgi:MFS family permease